MAKGFKKGVGGANPLNFKVVGGTTAPANPKENMIWVNTDQEITSWIFSVTEPTEPVEGMVWIYIGTSSAVEFNALKKNAIQIYPISAKQYISGAFVEKDFVIYQDGKWSESKLFLYNKGNQCTSVTGGWESVQDAGITTPQYPGLSYGESTMTASLYHNGYGNYHGGWIRPINALDLTNYSKLVCVSKAKSGTVRIGVTDVDRTWMEGNMYYYHAYADISAGTTAVDISKINGTYDVLIYLWNNTGGSTSQVEISQIYLEK